MVYLVVVGVVLVLEFYYLMDFGKNEGLGLERSDQQTYPMIRLAFLQLEKGKMYIMVVDFRLSLSACVVIASAIEILALLSKFSAHNTPL